MRSFLAALAALVLFACCAEAGGYGRTRAVFVPQQQVYAAPPVLQQDLGCYGQQALFAPAYAPQQQVLRQRVIIQRQFAPAYVPQQQVFGQRVIIQRQFAPSYAPAYGGGVQLSVRRGFLNRRGFDLRVGGY